MKITQEGGRLIIRETPVIVWVFGGLFAIVGAVFVYGALGGYSNYAEASRFTIGAHLAGGLIGIAVGLILIQSSPATTVTIDRSAQSIVYTTHWTSGRNSQSFSFAQIDSFTLLEEPDPDGDPVYWLGLRFNDGKELKISRLGSPSESYKRDFVFQANEFMQKPLPDYRDARDESRSKSR